MIRTTGPDSIAGGGGGVTSLTGTANQVVVSAPTGAVTISLAATVDILTAINVAGGSGVGGGCTISTFAINAPTSDFTGDKGIFGSQLKVGGAIVTGGAAFTFKLSDNVTFAPIVGGSYAVGATVGVDGTITAASTATVTKGIITNIV